TRLNTLKARKDAIEDELRVLRDRVKSMEEPVVVATRALMTYRKGMEDALRADERYGPGLVRTTLNLPILDYAPPHDIPGRQEVKNLFMKDIRVDYNFTDSYVTDRCTTCHIGIDDPSMTRDNLVRQAEQAIQSDAVAAVLRRENEKLIQSLAQRFADVDTTVAPEKSQFINAFIAVANGFLDETNRPRLDNGAIHAAFADRAPDRGQVQSVIEQQVRQILAAAPPMASDRPKAWRDMDESEREPYFKSLMAAINLYLVNNDEKSRPPIEYG